MSPAPHFDLARLRLGAGRKILLIENEPLIARMITTALLRDGHLVDHCPSGAEALEAITREQLRPEAVICSLSLADECGLATFRDLRDLLPAAPVIVIAGGDPALVRGELLEDLNLHLLLKPFGVQKLRRRLGSLL